MKIATLTTLLAGLLAVTTQSAELTDLEKLQATYAGQLKKIDASQQKAKIAIQEHYIEALSRLEQELQKTGRLEALLTTQKERERFTRERTLDESTVSVDVAELRSIQVACLASLDRLPADSAKQIMALAQQYDGALNTLQSELTRKARIDDAILIKQERDAISSRPEVTAAAFILADAESRKPPATAESVPDAERPSITNAPAEPPAVAPAPRSLAGRKSGVNDTNRIRSRFKEVSKLILDQRWDDACLYVDPRFLEARGMDVAKQRLRNHFSGFVLTQTSTPRFGVDEIRVSDDAPTAMLIPKVFIRKNWHTFGAIDWVRVKDEWFIYLVDERAAPKPPPSKLPPAP